MNFIKIFVIFMLMIGNGYAIIKYFEPTATGSNDGTDWTNAYNQIQGVTVYRDDTLLLGSGIADSFFLFLKRPDDGTKRMTLLKATEAFHGTETGWNASFANPIHLYPHPDTANGQIIAISTGYWTIDGRYRDENNWEDSSSYGIFFHLQHPVTWDTKIYGISASLSDIAGHDSCIVQYCAFEGDSIFRADHPDTAAQIMLSLTSIQSSKGHKIHRCFFKGGSSNIALYETEYSSIKYNYLGSNFSATTYAHSQSVTGGGNDYDTISTNIFEGSKTFVWGQHTDLNTTSIECVLANNIVMNSSDLTAVFANADSDASGWVRIRIFNNLCYNINPGPRGFVFTGALVDSSTDTCLAYNNLFVNCTNMHMGSNGTVIDYKTVKHNWNAWYNCDTVGQGDEANKIVDTGDPFTDSSSLDFTLTIAIPCTTLSTPFNIDFAGNDRNVDSEWDAGVYSFNSGSAVIRRKIRCIW